MNKKTSRKQKIKIPSLKELQQIRWDLFAWYIKLRDSDENGTAYCCTCKKRTDIIINGKPNQHCQAGHFITRKKKSTKYDDKNVHIQCSGCNNKHFGNGMPTEYRSFLVGKYGEDKICTMESLSLMEKKNPVKEDRFTINYDIGQYLGMVTYELRLKTYKIQNAYLSSRKYISLLKLGEKQ